MPDIPDLTLEQWKRVCKVSNIFTNFAQLPSDLSHKPCWIKLGNLLVRDSLIFDNFII